MRAMLTLLIIGLMAATPAAPAQPTEKPRPRFTIGPETTRVSGPINKDGYIDYAGALNARLRQGVTPENNACVLLVRALGPQVWANENPAERTRQMSEVYRWLEMQSLPEKGDYLIGLSSFPEGLRKEGDEWAEKARELLSKAIENPWTAKEYPLLADWIKANDKPLASIVEASKRSQYFCPIVASRWNDGASGLLGAPLTLLMHLRNCAQILQSRAMLSAGKGSFDQAWQDLMVCHRLARLITRGPMLMEGLVGLAIENTTSSCDLAILDRIRENKNRIRNCLFDLDKLQPYSTASEKVDLGERYFFLDQVMLTARGILAQNKQIPASRIMKDVDWDPVMHTANQLYDRIAAAMREKDRLSRELALNAIDADWNSLAVRVPLVRDLVMPLLKGKPSPEDCGRFMCYLLIGPSLVPDGESTAQKMHVFQSAYDRSEQTLTNAKIAFALALYRCEHGVYPKQLSALEPAILRSVPPDIFTGKPLIYRPAADGYLLYSVGQNGKDEKGQSFNDIPPGDDLAVRMPRPKQK